MPNRLYRAGSRGRMARTVDLVGLDRGVGLFCAKALDLPHEQGLALRAQLTALRAEIDQLTEAIRRAGED